MKKWRVYYSASVSHTVEVEAEDEYEAVNKADDQMDANAPYLCAGCSQEMDIVSEWSPQDEYAIEEIES